MLAYASVVEYGQLGAVCCVKSDSKSVLKGLGLPARVYGDIISYPCMA